MKRIHNKFIRNNPNDNRSDDAVVNTNENESELNQLTAAQQNKQIITQKNFEDYAPLIYLDNSGIYNGFETCRICERILKVRKSKKQDVRRLPCDHPFHGKCIFNQIIVQKRMDCLICLHGK